MPLLHGQGYRAKDTEDTGSGIILSEGEICNILTKEKSEEFSREKQEIFDAGMKSSEYFHIDDTSAGRKGMNHHVHVLCNTLFT